MRHPNVLRLYDSYREGENTVLILEYAEKGNDASTQETYPSA